MLMATYTCARSLKYFYFLADDGHFYNFYYYRFLNTLVIFLLVSGSRVISVSIKVYYA